MRSPLYLVAILAVMAMLRVPLLAQENSAEMRAPPSRPQAQVEPSQSPGFGNPRFVFHRIDGAFLRLDLSTGAVASCSQSTVDWTCVPGREERTALDGEIVRLQRDNAMLKNALLQHGVPLPDSLEADHAAPALSSPACEGKGGGETVPRPAQTVPPAASAPPPSAKSGEPDRASRDDAEIERMMIVMEKVWRRFVEMMMGIQRDLQKKG